MTLENTEMAFVYMMNDFASQLAAEGRGLPRDALTIVDVGARNMPYAAAMERWAKQQAKKVRIVAIDVSYDPNYPFSYWNTHPKMIDPAIELIGGRVEDALPKLKEIGIQKIDLITMFNPALREDPMLGLGVIPDVKNLDELCNGTPIVGAKGYGPSRPPREDYLGFPTSINVLEQALIEMGYRVIFMGNPVSKQLQIRFGFDYNPLFIALPRS